MLVPFVLSYISDMRKFNDIRQQTRQLVWRVHIPLSYCSTGTNNVIIGSLSAPSVPAGKEIRFYGKPELCALKQEEDNFILTHTIFFQWRLRREPTHHFSLMRFFITLSGFKQNCNTNKHKNYPRYYR